LTIVQQDAAVVVLVECDAPDQVIPRGTTTLDLQDNAADNTEESLELGEGG
jgi:hypothetical protein